jgi:hypothetical protein
LRRLFKREAIVDQPQRVYSWRRVDKCVQPRPAKPRKKNPKAVAILCPQCGRKDIERVNVPDWFRYNMATDSEGQVYRIGHAYKNEADLIRYWARKEAVEQVPTRRYETCWKCHVPMLLTKNGELIKSVNDRPEYPLHPPSGYFEDAEAMT